MILLDKVPLALESLNDTKAKQYVFAKEYNDTITYLHEHFPNGVIHFKRKGAQKYTKGADNFGREVPNMLEPVSPWRIPLQAYAVTGDKGKHLWACCLDSPEPEANGLWNMGRTRTLSIKESKSVDINKDPDLAFFLYKISPFVQRRLIAVADPVADDATLGEAERVLTERKYAVWNMLSEEDKLKRMARAYGVVDVDGEAAATSPGRRHRRCRVRYRIQFLVGDQFAFKKEPGRLPQGDRGQSGVVTVGR